MYGADSRHLLFSELMIQDTWSGYRKFAAGGARTRGTLTHARRRRQRSGGI